MATRAPFLTQPYGAYYHRDVPNEDEELTHVGPGTPERHGPGPPGVSSYHHRQPFPRRAADALRAGLDGEPVRYDMHRHAEGRREYLGADQRVHSPQYPPMPLRGPQCSSGARISSPSY